MEIQKQFLSLPSLGYLIKLFFFNSVVYSVHNKSSVVGVYDDRLTFTADCLDYYLGQMCVHFKQPVAI